MKSAIQQSKYITVLADGSTDLAIIEQKSVLARYVYKGVPVTSFLDIVPLEQMVKQWYNQGPEKCRTFSRKSYMSKQVWSSIGVATF